MRFLIRLVLIVLAAVVIAVVGLLMLPGDRIAQIAASQIAKQTGRDVEISSDSSISLYPTLGITTGRAVIGSTDWAENGPLFVADSVAIGIDVPALLGGTIRIQKLEATAPKIVLERAEDGRANWDFFPSSDASAPAPAQTAPTDSASPGYEFSLEHAIIRNASLTYVDRSTGTSQQFDNVDLDVSWPGAASAAKITLGISPFGERVTLDATVNNVLEIANGAVTPLQGVLKTGDAQLEFAGTASIAPQAAMQISLTAPDAGQLLRAAGQTPSALGLPKDFGPDLNFNGNVTFDGQRVAVRGMTAAVDGSTLTGDVDVSLGDVLGVVAKAAVDLKDVGQLMRVAGQKPESLGLASDFNPAVKSDVTVKMNGSDITATLRNLQATLGGGTFAGSADVALAGGIPNITAKIRADVPNVAQVAQQVGQPLTGFGLPESAAPVFSGNVTATIRGDTIGADISNLVAELAGAKASGAVKLTVAGGAPSVSGSIKANVPNTANLMSALGQTPADIPRGFGRAITVNTKLGYSGNTLKLSDLTVSLDQNTLTGRASVTLGGARPNVVARLTAGALDFSSLSSGGDSGGGSSDSGWSKDRIDASALGLVDADIVLAASSLDLGTLQLGSTSIGAVLDNARAVVKVNDVRAYQGAFKGQVVANNRSGLSVAAKLNAKSVALKPLLTALAGIDRIAGDANVNIDVLGAGSSVYAIMNSLRGSIAMSVPQGTISGVDFDGLMRSGNPNASLTKFSGLQASGDISKGVVLNRDLAVVTGRVDVAGKGRVFLGTQEINYVVTPVAKNVGDKDALSIPVRIKGPWSDVRITPDLERALELEARREADKLKAQAQEEIDREKAKLRAKAKAEAKKVEDRVNKKVNEAAKKATKSLNIDDQGQKLLENQVKQGLKSLLGGN